MLERVFIDPEIGKIRFVKSKRSHNIVIRIHPERGVRVGIPYYLTFEEGMRFFESKRDWLIETVRRQKETVGNITPVSAEQVQLMGRQANAYLPERFAWLAAKYGFRYNRLALKNNTSNWGSCSAKGNINLNIRLMMLPEYLRDYVILHELSHLVHHDHSPRFHALLESLCADFFNGRLPDGLTLSKQSKFPVSHALETEIRKRHTTRW